MPRMRLADANVRLCILAVVALSCCIADVNARQTGVQQFDQPRPGALSARNANYDIDVRLDHDTRTLTGRQTIAWRNISANATGELQFHLYWNAWRNPESTWLRERRLAGLYVRPREDAWSSSDIRRLRVRASEWIDLTSAMTFIAPDDGNAQDRTVMVVPLPFQVGPNETVEIELEWEAAIPRPFARTGYVDDYYFIAHWFPKLGVLEDDGWNTHQFHAATEFYADYGVYDVRVTLPGAFVVGASGREVSRTDNGDGTATHHYRGEDIHDFAWTASPDYLVRTRTFEHPTLPAVEMRLLILPEHEDLTDRYFRATAETLRYFGEWFGPYPYGYLTIVDPAFQGGNAGMEYPTLFTGRSAWLAPEGVTVPEATTIHEAGHQFWHTIVGTNEFEHAWMDEGMTTWGTARVIEQAFMPNFVERRFFGGFVPWVFRDIPIRRDTDLNRLPGYRANAEADVPDQPTFRYWPGSATFVTYNKTSLWLHTLEKHLGWPAMQRVMSTYFDRWKFRHPRPDDFFAVLEEVTGQDMTWFLDQTYRSSDTFDYGVQDLASVREGDRFRTTVVLRRHGEATFPVDVVTTLGDGQRIVERWDGLDRRVVYTYVRPAPAVSVEVDPRRVLLLDVNYTNNSRTLEPRADEAGLKWGLKWMVWLQDLLLTYAFFV